MSDTIAEPNPLYVAQRIQSYYADTLAQCVMYNWSDEFKVKELQRAVEKAVNQLGRIDFSKFSAADIFALGGAYFHETLMLLPTWAYFHLPYESELISINGEVRKVLEGYDVPGSGNYIDNDTRFGCLAYGVRV